MNFHSEEPFTKEDLLSLEQVYDEYERKCRDHRGDGSPDFSALLPHLQEHLRPHACEELIRIREEWVLGKRTQCTDALQTARQLAIPHGDRSDTALNHTETLLGAQQERFRMIQLLGQGSSGVVWKAFDLQLNRFVAIKFPLVPNESISDHFLREARAASRLNHPNVARIFEVQRNEAGCYLLSELVEGTSLSQRLEKCDLTWDESVEILIQVAKALAHAHEMGVIHRDLKPENILLNQDQVVKLVDFGLAKDRSDEHATLTKTGMVVGTPAYMSPEQVMGTLGNLTPQSDIFSFGVLFYQMLTGELPFRGSAHNALFQVANTDPVPPRQLRPEIPVELETICLRCLEKSLHERFADAEILVRELQRYQNGQPILSQPISSWGRLRKWAKRNKRIASWMAVSASLLVLLSLLGATSSWLISKAWRNERGLRFAAEESNAELARMVERERTAVADAMKMKTLADEQAKLASQETKSSREMIRFLESVFQGSDPVLTLLTGNTSQSAAPPTITDWLQQALVRTRQELQGQPFVQAKLLGSLGNTYRSLGHYDLAESLVDEAERRYDGLEAPTNPSLLYDRGILRFYRGWIAHDRTEWAEAEAAYRDAMEMLTVGSQPETLLGRADVAFQYARLLLDRNRWQEAIPLMEEALAIREEHLGEKSSQTRAAKIGLAVARRKGNPDLTIEDGLLLFADDDWASQMLRKYAQCWLLRKNKHWTEAAVQYDLWIKDLRAALPPSHPLLALALGDYVTLLYDGGDFRTAFPIAIEVISIAERIHPSHPKLLDFKLRLAHELLFGSRVDESSIQYQQVLARAKSTSMIENARHGLIWCNVQHQKLDVALEHAQWLWDNRNGKMAYDVAWRAFSMARVLQRLGREEEMSEMDALSLSEVEKAIPFPRSSFWLDRMATIYTRHERWQEAVQCLREAIALEREAGNDLHPRLADRLYHLAQNLIKQGKLEEVESLFRESLKIRETNLPEDDPRIELTRQSIRNLGR